MSEIETLVDWIEKKEKMVAMVAPSFPIMYEASDLIGKLKQVGFSYVVEVSVGAAWTNAAVAEAISKDDKSRYITAPCPSVVRMIRANYPHLLKYLALQIDSPMAATARRIDEKGLGLKKVFVGPCIAKKFEASEDRKELSILVITYNELNNLLEKLGIKEKSASENTFDWEFSKTRLYPISGGLAQSSEIKNLLSESELGVVSGWKNCREALDNFETSGLRLLDILFCEGGCVNGPGIVSNLSLVDRRARVVNYWQKSQLCQEC